jgi:hypothetical protein
MERPTVTPNTSNTSATPSADAIEQRVVALAEQLGRLVGTVQAKADGWMDVPALQEQVARIRDGASTLLGQLGPGKSASSKSASSKASSKQGSSKQAKKPAVRTAGRSGGKVDAPGKKHRKPAPRSRVKHSNQMIAKGEASRRMRRGPNKG